MDVDRCRNEILSELDPNFASSEEKESSVVAGISGGSTFAVAMEVANKAPRGSTILCMLADTAERYLSSVLFGEISPDMNSEEIKILNSTPAYKISE